MADPKYKLIYFDFRGKAEPLRWIFKYAGVPFEDFRLKETPHYISPDPTPEWDKLKSRIPYSQVPALEVNGEYLGQTQAIGRYLGKLFNLLGKDDWEAAQADALATYFFSEIEAPFMAMIRETHHAKKQELLEKYQKEYLPVYLGKLDSILGSNKTGSGFFVGKSVTWVDFIIAGFSEWLIRREKELFDRHPSLMAHYDKIMILPGVKEWIAERPDTPI